MRRGGFEDLQVVLVGKKDQMESWDVTSATRQKSSGPQIGWQCGNSH